MGQLKHRQPRTAGLDRVAHAATEVLPVVVPHQDDLPAELGVGGIQQLA
uniref:Uncharacterized protein n=1 Tax=uncultured bacterium esnapd26 TaxID=1366607 RepID=S5TLN7_9BACT|nr:hypothetical protein [uncultured bacterium esnapd26]